MELDQSSTAVVGGWSIGQFATLYAARSSSITGDVTNAGLIELSLMTPPSSQSWADNLSIYGNYTQTGTGQLAMGYIPPGNYVDHLTISGRASFAGTFILRTPDGYTPGPGITLQLITYGTRSGEFTSYVLPPGDWVKKYNDNLPDGPGNFLLQIPYMPPPGP